MSRTLQRLLQGIWLIVALITIYVTLRGIPLRFYELRTTSEAVWAAGEHTYVDKQLHPQEAEILFAAGLSVADYAAYILILELALTAFFFVSALLIFRQRRQEWLAVAISMALLCIGLTTPAIDSALIAIQPDWYLPLEAMQAFGLLVAFALTFLAFPDGRLTPPWTRYGLAVATMLMLAWLAFPDLPYNPINGESWEQTPLQSTLFSSALIGAAMWAQVQRYRNYATPLQRQQLKAGSFGFLMLFIAEVLRSLSYALTIPPEGPGALTFYVNVFRDPIFLLLVLFMPLGFGMAILRYQLWNLDAILRRTALYSLLTAGGVFVYVQIVIISSLFLNRLGDFGTLWFTAASALLAALLLLPIYRLAQNRINRAFNRTWIDFQAELAHFSRSVRTYLNVAPIAELLAERVCALMQCDSLVVALCNEDRTLQPTATRNCTVEEDELRALSNRFRARLARGDTVKLDEDSPFHLLVPLTVQRTDRPEVVGLLLCGPRSTGQPYDRAAIALLTGMADQAASAILVAEMVAAERRLEQHRNTPLGQAEILADACADDTVAQPAILALFERAVTDPLAAQQLAHLPAVLRSRGESPLTLLAEGCHLLVNGRKEIDDAAIGLQRVQGYLDEVAVDDPTYAGNQAILAFLQHGLTCANHEHLTDLLIHAEQFDDLHSTQFDDLVDWTKQLCALGLPLDKFQRSRNLNDRLAYLFEAVTQCTELHTEVMSSATLATLVMTPMLAHWQQILAGALRHEQSRSTISLAPVTRRVIAGRPTQLVLEARNEGLHRVDRISVMIQESEAVRGALAAAEAGSLLPGEATQLHFPITLSGNGPLSIAFRYQFTDEEGRDTGYGVALPFERIGNGVPFQTIPNPYVTGAPLRAQSPLFVGRRREMTFLHAGLNKTEETPVVLLTGPKRMGKTSLLFQLPQLLGDAFAPVYVDVQGIGYERGLSNLLLDIAVEIAHGLGPTVGLTPPTAGSLNGDGDHFFTQTFLPQVRAALGKRRLVLIFDEFEELAQRVAAGVISEDVFAYLRHLMQHEAQLAWVFAGTQRLADLSAPYWLSLFSGAVHSRVGMLDADDARRLIQEPVAGLLTYDDLAIDKILRLTAGHPYFTQVLCHALVLDANRARRTLVTAEDVDAATEKTMEMAEAHLLALWRELDAVEREVAATVARLSTPAPPVTVDMAAQEIAIHDPVQFDETLTSLLRRGLLAVDMHGRYRFVMELQRLWIVRQPVR